MVATRSGADEASVPGQEPFGGAPELLPGSSVADSGARMALTQIRVYRQAGAVRRYHTECVLKDETVGHHSANVAMIATILCGEVRPELLLYALTHDTGEVYTGDVPYPFKHQHPAVKAYLDNAEQVYKVNNGLLFACSPEDFAIVKAADMLDLVLKCLDELSMGNQNIIPMFNTGMRVLRAVQLPVPAQARLDEILKGIGDDSE